MMFVQQYTKGFSLLSQQGVGRGKKIKKSVVGNGNASKEQVQYMVKNILQLDKLPTPLDSSDALAIGLCYLNQNRWS